MDRTPAYRIEDMEYIIKDNEGSVIEDAKLSLVTPRPAYSYAKNKGELFDLTRKDEYKTERIRTLEDNSLHKMVISMLKVTNQTKGREQIHFVVEDGSGNTMKYRLSKKKAYLLMNDIHNQFVYDGIREDFDVPDIYPQTLMFMVLLRSLKYEFIKSDLVRAGMNDNNAKGLIGSMRKKGIIKKTGKVGNSNLYTCTIPREKLIAMFGRQEEIEC